MLDSNSAAERDHSAKVAKQGDAPDFSYTDKYHEAEAIVREMLKENAFEAIEMLSNDTRANSFDALIDRVGIAIYNDEQLMMTLSLLAKTKYADKIQERLEKEQGI